MYKPAGSYTLKEVSIDPQIRLGIQGSPGSGKTWAALTFPNPTVINLDRGLGAHHGRDDVIELPFWDDSYCRSVNPNHKGASSLKDTLLIFLNKEAKKFEPDQTLVWDGNTGLQNCYHKWYSVNKVYSPKSGKEDEWAEWNLKLQFYSDIFETYFKTIRSHFIFISHEAEKKEKSGEYLGKIRPLLSGSFQDQLASHFTDWVRQLTKDKPKDYNNLNDNELSKWSLTKDEYKAMCDTFPRHTIYYWQLESDDYFDGKISSLVNFPRFIPAHYSQFKKYSRVK